MSDFTSDFWNWYIIGLTAASIAFCAWLLISMAKAKAPAGGKAKTAPAAGGKEVEITGHIWDGDLAEFNNPLPRWWMWLFWITIAFSIGYLAPGPRPARTRRRAPRWTPRSSRSTTSTWR